MIRKIISCILSVAISLSLIILPQSVDAKNSNEDIIEIMSSLGFLKVIDKNDENAVVTRGEFLAELLVLADIKTFDNGVYFEDVDENHSLFAQISTAAGLGIVGGYDGKFNPDRQISYIEAVIMIENVLGYGAYIESVENKTDEYLNFASEIDLNENINAAQAGFLNVKQTAQILYNAGNAQMLSLNFSEGRRLEKGDSIFWAKHRIGYAKGVLLANQYTSIDPFGRTAENQVRIDDFTGYLYYNSANVDWLGYYVEYYYKIEDDEHLICYLKPYEAKNDELVLNPGEFEGYDSDRRIFEYYDKGKLKACDLTSDMSVIYNGQLTLDYYRTEDGKTKSIFDVLSGDITLIDNDGDGKYDVIKIISLKLCVVSGIDKTRKIIYGLFGSDTTLDFGDTNKNSQMWIITDKNGKIIPFAEIKDGDVLSYVKSDDGSYFHGVLSNERKTGTISSIYKDDADRTVIAIGQERFMVSEEFLKYNSQISLSVGSDVELSFDYKGEVVYVKGKASGTDVGSIVTSGYAFVIKKTYNEEDELYTLKMLVQNGKIERFSLSEKVTVDGRRYARGEVNNYMLIFDEYQMIFFQLNNDNEISVIDTVTTDTKNNNDKLRSFLSQPTDLMWENRVGTFGSDIEKKGKIITDSNTKIFKVPPKGESQYDDTLYSVTTMPTTITHYKVNAFSNDPESFIADVIQYVSGGGNSTMAISSPTLLVEKITHGLNKDDEPTMIIEGYSGSNRVKMYLDANYDASKQNPSFPSYDANKLKPGDLIKYTTNVYGDIDYISDVYIHGFDTIGNFPLLTTIFSSATFWGTFGWILSKEDNCFALVDNKEDLNSENINPLNVNSVVRMQKDTVIYKVTGSDRIEIEKIDYENLSAITDYKHNHMQTKAIVMGGQGYAYLVVVYQD